MLSIQNSLVYAGCVLIGVWISPHVRVAYTRTTEKIFSNPRKITDISEGKSLFLADCASCHGADAKGGRGPALLGGTQRTREELLRVVQEGIPGSTMPAFRGFPDEENNIVAYVLSLQPQADAGTRRESGSPRHAGNAASGMAIYTAQGCPGCHRIGHTGSVFGPALTRVGASRSYEYLRQSLIDPSAEITPGTEAVTAVTADGHSIRGIRVNEDTFTIQLRDSSQKFVSLVKGELRSLTHDHASLMPAYSKLPAADMEDLLAYLGTLRGTEEGNAAESQRVLR